MNEKSVAIQRLTDSRRMFLQAIEGLNPDQLTKAPVEGNWTISDLLCHIESWDRVSLEPLSDFITTGAYHSANIPDDLVWNDEQYEAWKKKELPERQRVFAATRQRFIDALEAVPDEQWQVSITFPWREQGTIVELVNGLVWHEKEHMKSILGWLDKRENS